MNGLLKLHQVSGHWTFPVDKVYSAEVPEGKLFLLFSEEEKFIGLCMIMSPYTDLLEALRL